MGGRAPAMSSRAANLDGGRLNLSPHTAALDAASDLESVELPSWGVVDPSLGPTFDDGDKIYSSFIVYSPTFRLQGATLLQSWP